MEVHKIVDRKKVDVDVKLELERPPEEGTVLPDTGGDVTEVPRTQLWPFRCPHCERECRRKRELERKPSVPRWRRADSRVQRLQEEVLPAKIAEGTHVTTFFRGRRIRLPAL
jgi:hypothetical protein